MKAGLAPLRGPGRPRVSGGQVTQETGLRCRMTYSSVPVPGPLLLPEGWPVWYGLAWVGHPVKWALLASNHWAEKTVGMTGRFSATYFSSGWKSVTCCALPGWSPAIVESMDCTLATFR